MHLPSVAVTAGLFALVLAFPLTAAADTYGYSFSETSTNPNIGDATFTYTSPVLISTDTTFTPLTCSTSLPSNGDCTTVEIDPGATAGNPQITINFASGGFLSFADLPDTFFTAADNSAAAGDDILDITDIPASTPEPSSFLLVATGLLAMCGVLRRRPIRAMMER